MEEMKRLFDLQLFSEEGSEAEAKETETKKEESKEEPKGSEPKAPFAVFPDQKSFMARVEREARKIYNNNLKELGVTSADELKVLVDNYRDLESSSNTEIMTRDERIKQLEEENQSLVNRITMDIKNKALKQEALTLGVQAERFERFARLIDMDSIEMKEGVVEIEPLKEQITALLDEFPEFRGVSGTAQGGSNFNNENKDKPKFTMEQIKQMTTEQIMANYAEVMSVIGNQK